MKAVATICFAVFISTNAVEVTEEDINSPLVSYLLDKVHQLESKMMVRSSTRSTRETTDKPTKPPVVAANNKQCNCPPNVLSYFRWGNSTCPYGADIVYSGVVAGSRHGHEGAAVDPLCIPKTLDQQYLKYERNYQGHIQLYGAQYKTATGSPLNHINNRNVPCALCQVTGRTNQIMIPSHHECPNGWRIEYFGYLMAGRYSNKAATQFTCMDESLELIPGSGSDGGGYLFYTVEANQDCGIIPCNEKELTCVVCSM